MDNQEKNNREKINSIIKEFCEEYCQEFCQDYKSQKTWDSFFYKKHTVILENIDLLIEECEKIGKNDNREKEQIYKSESFQDFVDKHIDFNKIGAYNYQVFCKSMNDSKFRNEICERYETNEKMKKIKNLLIYFIEKWNEQNSKIQIISNESKYGV